MKNESKVSGFLIFLISALLSCFGCREKKQAKPAPVPVVEVATVTQADVPIYHEWIGVLDGLVNAQIRAQVTGYLLTQKKSRFKQAMSSAGEAWTLSKNRLIKATISSRK